MVSKFPEIVFAARQHQAEGNAKGALERWEDALALMPAYPEALYGRAVALSDLGRHLEALQACKVALDMVGHEVDKAQLANEPREWVDTLMRMQLETLYLQGTVHLKRGDYADALNVLETMIGELNPATRAFWASSDYWFIKGLCLLNLRQYQGATWCFEEAHYYIQREKGTSMEPSDPAQRNDFLVRCHAHWVLSALLLARQQLPAALGGSSLEIPYGTDIKAAVAAARKDKVAAILPQEASDEVKLLQYTLQKFRATTNVANFVQSAEVARLLGELTPLPISNQDREVMKNIGPVLAHPRHEYDHVGLSV